MTACTYISALLCLLANSMHNPVHETVESDKVQIDIALKFVDEFCLQTDLEPVRKLRDICRELQKHTLVIAENERRSEESPFRGFEDMYGSSRFRQDNDDSSLQARHPLLDIVSGSESSFQLEDQTSWGLDEGLGANTQAWLPEFNLGSDYVS